MKRTIIILLFLLLPSLAIASPELHFQHNQTSAGETILATITTTGEFIEPIKASDIIFYEGRREVSFESGLTFYNGTYYFYIYTNRVGNFSVDISNILYSDGGGLKSINIIKQFNVSDGIIRDEKTNKTFKRILSIKPGFVSSVSKPKIKLTNLGDVTLNLKHGENKTSLVPMESKEMTLSPTTIFSYFNISSYKDFSVPIIYLGVSTNKTNRSIKSIVNKSGMKQVPKLLFAELFTNNKTEKTIQLFNFGDGNITDVSAKTDISFVEIDGLGDIRGKGIRNISVVFNPDVSGHFKGNINITYTQYEKSNLLIIPVSLFVLPSGSNSKNFTATAKTCDEMSGTICKNNEFCDGRATFTKNGDYCCLSNCVANQIKSKSGGYGWLVGIFILLIIAIVGYYFYKKQKKIVPKNSNEQLKEISDKFSKRMSGNSGKRVSGGLSKS